MDSFLEAIGNIVRTYFPKFVEENDEVTIYPVEDEPEIEGTQEDMGCAVESEHRRTLAKIKKSIKDNKIQMTDEEIFRSIANDHIKELPDYYTRLKKMEGEKNG